MPGELNGTIVPLVTPFADDESFAPRALAKLVEWVVGQGADGLMPTALTGEGLLLSVEETLAAWDVVFQESAGLPVVPAILSLTTRHAVELSRAAEARGAAAVMVAPLVPELYARRAQEDVLAFHAEVAEATTLDLVLFNYPSLTGVDLVPSLVKRLAEIERVRYIKESSGDSRRIHQIQREVGERLSVICGSPDTALESFALGCRTWITGILNVVPCSGRQLRRAVAEKKDLTLARRIYHQQILPLVDVLSRNHNPTGAIKAGVIARGVNVGTPRRPGRALPREEQDRVTRLVAELARAEAATESELGSGTWSRVST